MILRLEPILFDISLHKKKNAFPTRYRLSYFKASNKIVSIIKTRAKTVKLTRVFSVAFHPKTFEAYGKIQGKPIQPCNYLNRGHKSKINICGQ